MTVVFNAFGIMLVLMLALLMLIGGAALELLDCLLRDEDDGRE